MGDLAGFIAPAISLGVGLLAGPTRLPDAQGPRLSDLSAPRSDYGQVIPHGWGAIRLAGNLIWASDLIEVASTSTVRTGKGGGAGTVQNVTNYSYQANFAVLLCEGPIVGIRKIWLNNKPVYDRSTATNINAINATNSISSKIRIYLGTEDQTADSLIQSYEGADFTPAYRGRAYLVFDHLPLDSYGNRIPSVSCEIVVNGTISTVSYAGSTSSSPSSVGQYLYVVNSTTAITLAYTTLQSFTSLKSSDGATTYVNGTDYTVSLSTGVITIPTGSPIRSVFASNVYVTVQLVASYKVAIAGGTFDVVTPATVPLSNIVTDIGRFTGLADTDDDGSDLVSIAVKGFAITAVESARNSIDKLRKAYFFDAIESDGLLRYKRQYYTGKPITDILPSNLAAHEDGQEVPELWRQTRIQEIDLPMLVNVNFQDFDRSYADNTASYRKQVGNSFNQATVDLSGLVLQTSDAIKIAQRSLFLAWAGRNSYTFQFCLDFAAQDPSDFLNFKGRIGGPFYDSTYVHDSTITYSGGQTADEALIIDSIDFGANFLLIVKATSTDILLYPQTA